MLIEAAYDVYNRIRAVSPVIIAFHIARPGPNSIHEPSPAGVGTAEAKEKRS